jgi:hypothetical protein
MTGNFTFVTCMGNDPLIVNQSQRSIRILNLGIKFPCSSHRSDSHRLSTIDADDRQLRESYQNGLKRGRLFFVTRTAGGGCKFASPSNFAYRSLRDTIPVYTPHFQVGLLVFQWCHPRKHRTSPSVGNAKFG